MVRTALAFLMLPGVILAQDNRIPSPGSGAPIGATPGGVPVLPVANNPQAEFAKLPQDLQTHLLAWEKRTTGLQTMYVDAERDVTRTLENKVTKFKGSIRCMKPNLAYLRMDNIAKKEDFEAYICDGKSVFVYMGLEKTVMQHPIPPGGKGNVGDNLLLEFMSGAMTAADVAARFALKLLKEDQHYVYLQVMPQLDKDKREFDSLILVLYGAKVQGLEYLPAKVQMKLNNGQVVDEWTFMRPMANPAGIRATDFAYVAPPKDWQVKTADPKRP